MENYTKYKLKSSDELTSVLNGRDNLFVIACNKCFKEFETVDEPDCEEFLKFAAEQGKNVTGSAKFDFLCNKMHTERKLQDLIPEGTENVVVISCGLGIQTVAAFSRQGANPGHSRRKRESLQIILPRRHIGKKNSPSLANGEFSDNPEIYHGSLYSRAGSFRRSRFVAPVFSQKLRRVPFN